MYGKDHSQTAPDPILILSGTSGVWAYPKIRIILALIFDLNFDTYALPRFSWLPKIETVILENPNLAPQGGGEPAIIGMGGVIATAIHDAVGAAVFQLPMTPARVKAAMKQT
jgi:hypothetical protein